MNRYYVVTELKRMDTEDRVCICVVGESEIHREGLVEVEGNWVR